MKNTLSICIILFTLLTGCKKKDDVIPLCPFPAEYENQGTIEVKSRNLTICVWDWSTVDGDIIDLLVNCKTLLTNHQVMGDKHCFDVKLPTGENWIGIVALNEGTVGGASPHLEINDGVSTQGFDISAEINKPGGYKIKMNL